MHDEMTSIQKERPFGSTDLAPTPDQSRQLAPLLLNLPLILTGIHTLCNYSRTLPDDQNKVRDAINKLCGLVNALPTFGSTEEAPAPLQPQDLSFDWAKVLSLPSLLQAALGVIGDLDEGVHYATPSVKYDYSGFQVSAHVEFVLSKLDSSGTETASSSDESSEGDNTMSNNTSPRETAGTQPGQFAVQSDGALAGPKAGYNGDGVPSADENTGQTAEGEPVEPAPNLNPAPDTPASLIGENLGAIAIAPAPTKEGTDAGVKQNLPDGQYGGKPAGEPASDADEDEKQAAEAEDKKAKKSVPQVKAGATGNPAAESSNYGATAAGATTTTGGSTGSTDQSAELSKDMGKVEKDKEGHKGTSTASGNSKNAKNSEK
jgi:hypothetical protein